MKPDSPAALRSMLDDCPLGFSGWRTYEKVALSVMCHLFVPPLKNPHEQARSYYGTDRIDAIFPNRVTASTEPWGLLRHDHDAKYILVEFKNYSKEEIGKEEIDQTCGYLKVAMGRLAIVCCNKVPAESAFRRRNTAYTQDKTVILFITTDNLKEMLDMKERGDDPAEFIVDSVDRFLIQHE